MTDVSYSPYGEGTPDVTTTHYVRQNPWNTNKYSLDIVRATGAIHIPFAHAKNFVDLYNKSPAAYVPPAKSTLVMELPVGTRIIIAGVRQGLIAEITSEVKAGVLDPVYVASHEQTTIDYFLKGDNQRLSSALNANLTLTPFYTLYRTVSILGTITDVDDWRHLVQMSASGSRVVYFWKKNK